MQTTTGEAILKVVDGKSERQLVPGTCIIYGRRVRHATLRCGPFWRAQRAAWRSVRRAPPRCWHAGTPMAHRLPHKYFKCVWVIFSSGCTWDMGW